MRMGLNMALSRAYGGGAAPASTSALSENFATSTYSVGATSYSPITTLPGYTFTRSGIQGAVDAAGAVQFFAANVAAINSAGYHAFGALTNYLLQSQALNTANWSALGAIVAANTAVAPDGTTTMDRIVEDTTSAAHCIYGPATGIVAGTATFSAFVKGGTQRYVSLRGGSVPAGGGFAWMTIDTQTGAVASNTAGTGYAVNCGGGIWRAVLVYTYASDDNQVIALSNVAAAPTTSAATGNVYLGASLDAYAWQAQTLQGNFPDGGPIITTTTAAVGIGASVMAVNLANGTYSATYTFDDNSTQTNAALVIADGVLNTPADFVPNRNIIKQLLVT